MLIEDADLTRELGLDLTAPARNNERLVHLHVTGWGPKGPWAEMPGGEICAQLATEVTMSLGRFGERPVRVGVDLASMYAGVYGTQGVLAALYRRSRDGLGQRVDVSLYGCLLVLRSVMWAALSNPDDWSGFHLDSYRKPPESGFKTKNGLVSLTLGRLDDEEWSKLLADFGFDPERDAAKMSLLKQIGNPDTSPRGWESRPVWEEAFSRFTTDEVIAIVASHGGGGYAVNDYTQVFETEQVKLLAPLLTVPLNNGETVQVIRHAWRLRGTPARIEHGPPLLGEHNEEVLGASGESSVVSSITR